LGCDANLTLREGKKKEDWVEVSCCRFCKAVQCCQAKVRCERNHMSPRNCPVLVCLLYSVLGWEQPLESVLEVHKYSISLFWLP